MVDQASCALYACAVSFARAIRRKPISRLRAARARNGCGILFPIPEQRRAPKEHAAPGVRRARQVLMQQRSHKACSGVTTNRTRRGFDALRYVLDDVTACDFLKELRTLVWAIRTPACSAVHLSPVVAHRTRLLAGADERWVVARITIRVEGDAGGCVCGPILDQRSERPG